MLHHVPHRLYFSGKLHIYRLRGHRAIPSAASGLPPEHAGTITGSPEAYVPLLAPVMLLLQRGSSTSHR
jgi:hypothetical protein